MQPSPQAQIIQNLRAQVDAGLANLIDKKDPAQLYDAINYVLEGPGKRVRGILVLLCADLYGANFKVSMHAALAVEVFHAFTLVHDDILDHSDLRRGRETVHVRWDEATAILVGDYLAGFSVTLLSRIGNEGVSKALQIYSHMLAELCEGQILDLELETDKDATVEKYLAMIEKKTGALISAAMTWGGICGSATQDDLNLLAEIGWNLGRAFQIQDDLLDIVAADEKWGKKLGGDLINGKRTILLLESISRAKAEQKAFFESILTQGAMDESDVDKARQIMEDIGVLEAVRSSVILHSDKALALTQSLPAGASRETLKYLVRQLRERAH